MQLRMRPFLEVTARTSGKEAWVAPTRASYEEVQSYPKLQRGRNKAGWRLVTQFPCPLLLHNQKKKWEKNIQYSSYL